MASGKCHDAVALVSTAALIPIAFYSSRVIAPFVVAGAIAGGAIISPDIDLAHSLPAKRWGIMRPLTKLYRMFHYRHRGASHWPIVGAGLRSLLLILLLFGVQSLLNLVFDAEIQMFNPLIIENKAMGAIAYQIDIPVSYKLLAFPAFWFYLGVEFASMLHVLFDLLATPFKALQRI